MSTGMGEFLVRAVASQHSAVPGGGTRREEGCHSAPAWAAR
jgi:hypothetical protein